MVKNKDKWSALSMSERADLIKLYVEKGVKSINEIRKDYNGIPYRDFHSSNYDYFGAHPSNAPTEEGGHWTSRNPKTGQLLKREDHPTFNLMVEGEKQANYDVVRGLDGNLYSTPKEPTNYVEENSLGDGGILHRYFQSLLESKKKKFGDGGPNEGGWSEESLEQRSRRHKRYDPTGGLGPITQGLYILAGGNKAKGEENEYWKAYLGLDNDVPKMNPNAKTSWDDKIEAEKIANGELPSDFYGTTPRMDLNLQAIVDTLNTGEIYRNYDEYKEVNPNLPSKRTIKTIYETGKRVLDNPNKWQQIEGDKTAIKKGLELSTNESSPLGMLADFGMLWNPKDKAIYVHDTYDFPKASRVLVGDRPKEMKIRGKINFDPNKGSKLLRDNMSGFNDYPSPINLRATGGPNKDTIPMFSDEEGNLFDIIPGVVDIRDLNRREVKRLAQEIAGRDTHDWDITNRELASGLATVQGKHRDQEARFNREFEKQYKKNLEYSKQLSRAKKASKGDTAALVDYMNYGQNKAASYLAPLLGIPATSVIASTGVVAPVIKSTLKTMMNPASAKTTAGALAATGLDATGVAFGSAGMGNTAENWMRGDFAPSDIPAFALNAIDAIPGAAAVNATIGAAQDAKRVRQAARYINDAVNDINMDNTLSNPNVSRLASDFDIDINTFLRRAPEDMVNVEPSHTIEETSVLNTARRAPEQFDWDAFEEANPDPIITTARPDDTSIVYGNRRITRGEIERLLRENGATQEELDSVLDDFDSASNIGDGESFWWTSSGHRMNNLIPRQNTDFIDLGGDRGRLYREDLERALRSAGYEQDVIGEALLEFDQAYLGMDPYAFERSISGRLYDRLRRGIGRNEIELSGGDIIDADEATTLLRNLGYNENAINRLINNSLREGHLLHPNNPSLMDLTDDGLRMHISNLDEDIAIDSYVDLLSRKKGVGSDLSTGRYKEYTRTLSQESERTFKAFAERMSKIFDDNIDFTDLSEDNYVKIKDYLRSKGWSSGDIEHMNWFQMNNSLPRDRSGNVLVIEKDGTTRPLMFGERPNFTIKGNIQAGKQAMQMYDDIPRGYAVAETNTSVDSEKLKLRGATSRYGFEPNQFSVEIANNSAYVRGNNLQHERLYLRDILKYKDQLPESEQILLDKLLNNGYKHGTVGWEELQGTKLLEFIKNEYSDLTNRLVETLSIPWRRIKSLDPRDEIQNAPMPSYKGSIDADIRNLLEVGNFSPYITRQPIHVVKHADGGPLKSGFDLSFDYDSRIDSYPSNYVEDVNAKSAYSLERETFDNYTSPYTKWWNKEDVDYLYSRLGDTGFTPEAVMYALGTESGYNPYAKSKISSAIGLGQLTKGTLKSMYPNSWEDIYDQYINEERGIRNVIDDAISNLSRINKNITSERDNLGYGRLKVNLLAPNSSLDSRISGVILKSLTKEQKKKVTDNFTYRDLMKMYQEEFDKKFK